MRKAGLQSRGSAGTATSPGAATPARLDHHHAGTSCENRALEPGEKILCFVPESGRFTVAYMLFEVAVNAAVASVPVRAAAPAPAIADTEVIAPALPRPGWRARDALVGLLHRVGLDLARPPLAALWRTPLVAGRYAIARFALPDYLNWMENWIPQVREGSKWMRTRGRALRRAATWRCGRWSDAHAGDEQLDYNILFEDYRKARAATVASH